jgi:N-acyl-D-amino-acid deacylase
VADITIFDPETVTDNATNKIGSNGFPSARTVHLVGPAVIVQKSTGGTSLCR